MPGKKSGNVSSDEEGGGDGDSNSLNNTITADTVDSSKCF